MSAAAASGGGGKDGDDDDKKKRKQPMPEDAFDPFDPENDLWPKKLRKPRSKSFAGQMKLWNARNQLIQKDLQENQERLAQLAKDSHEALTRLEAAINAKVNSCDDDNKADAEKSKAVAGSSDDNAEKSKAVAGPSDDNAEKSKADEEDGGKNC